MAAPAETQALEALQAVQSLPAAALDQLITDEIGEPLLGVFKALARAAGPDEEAAVAPKVHLMVLAYLIRRHLEGARVG